MVYRNVCLLRPLKHALSLKQAGALDLVYLFLQMTLYLPVHRSPLSVKIPSGYPQARLVQSKITLPVCPEIIASSPCWKSLYAYR
jgi:hypothetical protein